jgi:uncharacterized membrane protein
MLPVGAAFAIVLLAVAIAPPGSASSEPPTEQVPFATVRSIIQARCQTCHSDHPTRDGFSAPPLGVTFDTPEQIQAQAARIEQMAVISKAMPLNNVTGMTQAERDTLEAWIRQGAALK